MSTISVKFGTGLEGAYEVPVLSITERHHALELLIAYDSPAIVAACMRQNIAWVNSLDPDCYLDLAKKFGSEVFKMAVAASKKDPIAALRLAPIFHLSSEALRMMTKEETANESLFTPGATSLPTPAATSTASSDSSSAPPPAASAPATPTGSAT